MIIASPEYEPVSDMAIEILSPPEIEDRYTRIRQLGWNRKYLQDAYALVVGAGALGNEVLKNLALLGWGNIIVIDTDSIEDSNLTRSVLFRKSDVEQKRYKAEVVAERVREINPDVHILPVIGTLQEQIGLGIFRRMDIVFGCLDNRQARLDVSRACFRSQTPYIDAGLNGIDGDVQVFVPPYTACYGCTLSQAARQRTTERHSCLKLKIKTPQPIIPTAPTISSMMAGWQTQIGVKLLHGKTIPAGQRIAVFGEADVVEQYTILPNPNCIDHAAANFLPESDIIQTPFQTSTTTLRQLIDYVRNDLDMGDETVIQFDFDVLLSGTCSNCHYHHEFYRRQSSFWLQELVCPFCKALMSMETEYLFDGNEPYVEHTLAELGVPPLHILLAVNRPRRLYRFLELGGDLVPFFTNLPGLNPKLMPVYLSTRQETLGAIMAPKRLSIHRWIDSNATGWGIADLPSSPASWHVLNISQNFEYAWGDSLLDRQTMHGDQLFVEIVEES